MSEEKKTPPAAPKTCERLDAAYRKMKADPKQENYIAMLEAFEADLKAGAVAFIPISKDDVETLKKSGSELKWPAVDASQGKLLSMFTERAQADRAGTGAVAAIPLGAFANVLLSSKDLAGFALNPGDGKQGFLLDRKNIETAMRRAGAMPALDRALVSDAAMRLAQGCAVGVPTPVYEFTEELKAAGGPDAILKPVLDRWQQSIQSGAYKPASAEALFKDVLKDVMTMAFVAGALVRRDPAMIKDANADECIERVPYLRDDLVQNTDEFLVLLMENVRRHMGPPSEEAAWAMLSQNMPRVAFGAMGFGFGWGIAKSCEAEGPEALAALKERQQRFLRDLRARQMAAVKAKEEAAAKAKAEAKIGG